MEFMEYLAGAFLFVAIFSVILQLGMSYALQTLANKNDLPEFARFLAWVPLVNLYPAIAVSGLSFKKFLLGLVGFIVGLIALGMVGGLAGEGVGAIVGAGGGFLMALGALYYVGLVMWKTAERRGLPGFIGLLALIPFFGLFAYAYVAFHDGFEPLNKAGFALGFLLAVGPMVGQYQMMQTVGDTLAQIEVNEEGVMEIQPGALQDAMGDAGSMMELVANLSAAQGLDPSVPEQAEQLGSVIVESRRAVAQLESTLGPDGVAEMNAQLDALEMQLQQGFAGGAPQLGNPAMQAGLEGSPPAMGMTGQPNEEVVWAIDSPAAPATAGAAYDPANGFDVPSDVACPGDTQLRGSAPPEGFAQWCELSGGLKHGWYTEWHQTGLRKVSGEYRDGMRIGVWTRWFSNGTKRAQAEFRDGMQEGRLLAWDRAGTKVRELSFSQGEPASR